MISKNELLTKEGHSSSTLTIKTICYGKVREWQSREEAEKFFLECLAHSEGAEHERYLKILLKIKQGLAICSDN